MPNAVECMLNVLVDGAPMITLGRRLDVSATDAIVVTVPARTSGADGEVIANVQPSPSGKVKVLVITASAYHDSQLRFEQAGNGTSPVETVNLDGPQVLLGSQVIDLLGTRGSRYKFTNGTAEPVTISIFVARDAV
jgi:hypothetical protein